MFTNLFYVGEQNRTLTDKLLLVEEIIYMSSCQASMTFFLVVSRRL